MTRETKIGVLVGILFVVIFSMLAPDSHGADFQPDCDANGRIDMNDFGCFQRCYSGALPMKADCWKPPTATQPVLTVCTKTLTPADKWQQAIDNARPGDTICLDEGTYKAPATDWNYTAGLMINVSGEPGKPITIKNVPGKTVTILGSKTYAVRIGAMDYRGPHDPSAKGVHDVVLDGIRATGAPGDGIEIANSWNVVVRNCWAYGNNASGQGYKAGINIDAGHDITIDHCRIFDNGFGICGYEHQEGGHEWPNPSGPYGVTLSNNFVFGNSRSGNLGNSPGMDIRFATHCTYTGNIFYDNPDAGINGEGNVLCKIVGNICINQWQEPGNREGGKVCVRGGGGNLVAFNLFVGNDNCGWDATDGVGDLHVNNTYTDNGSWGFLAEGRESMIFNCIIAGNSTRVDNAYPNLAATGWSIISDWNTFGPGPITGQDNDTLTQLPPNTRRLPVEFDGFPMRRNDVRQVIQPEQAFGCSTIEEARARIVATYRPSAPMAGGEPLTTFPGLSMADIEMKADRNIPAVKAACDAAIAKAATSPDFQMKQATFRWQELKRLLTSYDLSGLPDSGVQGAVK